MTKSELFNIVVSNFEYFDGTIKRAHLISKKIDIIKAGYMDYTNSFIGIYGKSILQTVLCGVNPKINKWSFNILVGDYQHLVALEYTIKEILGLVGNYRVKVDRLRAKIKVIEKKR